MFSRLHDKLIEGKLTNRSCAYCMDHWNVSYNHLVKFDMPQRLRLVGYVENVATLATRRTNEQVQSSVSIIMRQVSR